MQPKQPFSLGKKSRYPAIFLGVAAALITGILLFIPPPKQPELFLPAVAAAAGFAYFLYSQHLQETKLFSELFRQFNSMYDELNEDLNRIAAASDVTMLGLKDKQVLFDYFNLCAEEYLYFKSGFIDPEVWNAWVNGMQYFVAVQHIRNLWGAELAGGSYYGFTLGVVESKA